MFDHRQQFTLSLVFLVISSTAFAEGELIPLRYKFKEGQVVRYQVSMRDDYNVQFGGETYTPYNDQQTVKSYRVVSVNEDGSAVLELTFESVVIKMMENESTYEFDSHKKENPDPKFAAMSHMIGKPHVQMTVSATGEVLKFTNLINNVEQDVDEARQAAMDVLLRLPEDPIAVGSSWREDFQGSVAIENSSLKKPVKMQRRYYFKSYINDLATIELKTTIITKLSPAEEIQLIRRQPQGAIVLNTAQGLQISKTFTQDNTVQNFQQGACVANFKQTQTETLKEQQTANALNGSTK